MHPRYFPDELYDEAYEAASIARESFPTQSKAMAAIDELMRNYEDQYDGVFGLIDEAILSHRERFESSLVAYQEDDDEHDRVLAELLERRDALSRETMAQLAGLLESSGTSANQ